jgi:ribonuclease HII
MDKNIKYIIGIDEVGRGPIAGPVTVCAFLVKDEKFLESCTGQTCAELPKLRDSKKLSKKQREVWFEYLKVAKAEGKCSYSVSFVSSENIDKFGIAKCIQKALNESLLKLTANTKNQEAFYIYLDGGLKAPKEYVNQETVIKGDEIHLVISMASIMEKVSRDRIMERFSKEFPEYGFDNHVGYGTKAHYDAIKRHGQTKIHRKTFIH